MPEDDSRSGVCDLTIDPVMSLDEGVYQCQVSPGFGSAGLKSEPVKLAVNIPPGKPKILQGDSYVNSAFIKGDNVELECESHGAKPFAELSWLDENDNPLIFDVIEQIKRIDKSNTFKSVSTVTFKMEDNQMRIKCAAHSDAFPVPAVSQILELGDSEVSEPAEEVIEASEGETFEIVCSDRVASDYQWFVNDNLVIDETENILNLIDFTKAYDKSVIKCAKSNKAGKYHVTKIVRLKHNITPIPLPQAEALEQSSPKMIKELESPKKTTKKSLFNCMYLNEIKKDSEMNDFIEMKRVQQENKKQFLATDSHGNNILCKQSPDSYGKLKQIATKSKTFSKTLKMFSKTLDEIIGESKA